MSTLEKEYIPASFGSRIRRFLAVDNVGVLVQGLEDGIGDEQVCGVTDALVTELEHFYTVEIH